MREIDDEIDPEKYIAPLFKDIFRHLQLGKALEPMVFYEGCYLLNLDGTGFFSFKEHGYVSRAAQKLVPGLVNIATSSSKLL